MERLPRAGAVRFVKATAVTVILGVCMAFLPLGLPVLMPFLALPLAYLAVKSGWWPAVALAVVSAGLVWAVAGLGFASLVVLVLLGLGLVLGRALRRGWSFGKTLGFTACGTTAAFVAWGVVLWRLFDVDFAWLRQSAFDSIDRAAATYNEMGVTAATTDAVSAQMRHLIDIAPYLAPGMLGMAVVLLVACSIGLAYALLPRLRDKVEVSLALSGFRMHWSMAYLSIVGLALLVFSRGDAPWQTVALYSGIDLLLVAQTLFFLQGLAVIRWLTRARRVQPGTRAVLYVGAVLGQALFQLTGLFGLFDTWLDWRKRSSLKSPRTGSLR